MSSRRTWTPTDFHLDDNTPPQVRVIAEFAARAADNLPPIAAHGDQALNQQLPGQTNHIGWLLWHAGRQMDTQLADITGREELWPAYRDAQKLGALGDTMGYGHTPDEVRAIQPASMAGLIDYIRAGLFHTVACARDEDFDRIIDTTWDPPITVMMRLVSIIDDVNQHLAQVAFILGGQAQNTTHTPTPWG